jgi:hypothetical protein
MLKKFLEFFNNRLIFRQSERNAGEIGEEDRRIIDRHVFLFADNVLDDLGNHIK